MKRIIIYSALLGWLAIFLLATNVIESTVMFLLFGILPWGSGTLNPQIMLGIYYAIALGVFAKIFTPQIKTILQSSKTTTQRQPQA